MVSQHNSPNLHSKGCYVAPPSDRDQGSVDTSGPAKKGVNKGHNNNNKNNKDGAPYNITYEKSVACPRKGHASGTKGLDDSTPNLTSCKNEDNRRQEKPPNKTTDVRDLDSEQEHTLSPAQLTGCTGEGGGAGSTGDPHSTANALTGVSTGDHHACTSITVSAIRHRSTGDHAISTRMDTQYEQATTQQEEHYVPDFLRRIEYPHLESHTSDRPWSTHYMDEVEMMVQHDDSPTTQPHTGGGFRGWPFPAPNLGLEAARLYDITRSAKYMNHAGPKQLIKTSLVVEEWDRRATGHADDCWILGSIRYGFPIQYSGPPILETPTHYNHPSANKHADAIREYIRKETSMGALYGPFSAPPFTPWMAVSPLMTREKPDSTERRVIVDLSYPNGGINKFISPHTFNGQPAMHQLPTVDHVVKVIAQMCPGRTQLAVIDLSRAYRQFPVPPTDWPLLGISFEGAIYFDGRIPFGARMSSFAMQSVAGFITRALAKLGIKSFMYLDDIIMISNSPDLATRQYEQAIQMLTSMGLQVAHHKLQPPSREVTWLGIDISLEANTLSIPADKLKVITKCLAAAARQKKITKNHMQSILGYINHLAKVVRAARIFIARLLAALRAAKDDIIDVTTHVKADLGWFSRYLAANNARTIIPHNRTVLRIWADSSLKGGGATDGERCYAYSYPPNITAQHHITQLEALNVLAAVRTFVDTTHAAGTIEVYCDNEASIASYTSGRARDHVLAACCRAMWYHAAQTQTELVFAHTSGESMVLPDALSRSHQHPRHKAKAYILIRDLKLSEIDPSPAVFSYRSFV